MQSYLPLHCGEPFRAGNSAREFALGQAAARVQARLLRREGIVESIGANEGACYGLAFHRECRLST